MTVAIDREHDYYFYIYFDADSAGYNAALVLWNNSSTSAGLGLQRVGGNVIPALGGNIPYAPWTGSSSGNNPPCTGVPTIVSVLAA